MKRTPCTVLAIVAALGLQAAFGQAIKGSATVVTTNTYSNSIWITIYDLGKTTHLDYGCVNPNSYREWQSGTYLYGSFYYVRGEVKADADCGGRTLCDTTVQINPQSPGPVSPGGMSYDVFKGTKVSLHPNGTNCYWKHDN